MTTFKCKICGGELNVTEGMKICECEYCGTKQTLPTLDDEKKTNLFNRANKLRMVNEFDKAAGIYESIAAEFKNEAEAYWGLCLCEYGIEYVDDPKTAEKIPTCHRTSFESILECDNYKKVLSLSDSISAELYEKEAKQIDELQKDILGIVKDEKPFDVFICYKETDASNNRTQDSVLAEDIYEKLTEKGFKVFFSRITLEDKLGKEYEPYIFAALNSAKVMLAVGTNEDNYNAVWVKNEWARYLNMMKKDKSKTLIPCYKDMDPYDLPVEFKNLQGQDMSKVGFIQDLIRGINKVIRPEDQANYSAKVSVNNQIVETMLDKANNAFEQKSYKNAVKYYENVLDYDENNEEAKSKLSQIKKKKRIKKAIVTLVLLLVLVIVGIFSWQFISFNLLEVGDTIQFGQYNDSSVEWEAMGKSNGYMLLVSKNVLFDMVYDENNNSDWNSSSLKKYLNDDFYNNTFGAKDKKWIGDYNIDKETNKVFILSPDEVNTYCQSHKAATDLSNKKRSYWLRASSKKKASAPMINHMGLLDEVGMPVSYENNGVRPAIWVKVF